MTDLAAPTPRFLADVYEAASECNKCSLCQAVCPTYVVNPVEWETARGRVSLVRDAIEGRLELQDIAEGPLSTCLTCNNCVAACAPRVPTAEIVSRARQELHEQEGAPRGQTLLLRAVLPRPGGIRMLHRLSRFAQATGLRRLGLTRLMGTAGAMSEHVGPLPSRRADQRVRRLPEVTAPVRGRVGFLICCYQNLAAPEATEASVRMLLANGYAVEVPQLGCFGLPAQSLGDRSAALDMAVRTVNGVSGLQVDAMLGDVASCTGHVQRFGHLLASDRTVGDDAQRIAQSTELASVFLHRAGLRAPLGPLRWSVAIDEPCSLPIDGSVRSVARSLLEQVPHLQIRALREAAMCCGGPGAYFASQPERSEAILARKFENVIASGADVLVTENISCITQLRRGSQRYAPNLRVVHLMEVLDAATQTARRRQPLPQN